MTEDFDLDAGVADIADSLGLSSSDSEDSESYDDNETVTQQEELPDGLQQETDEAQQDAEQKGEISPEQNTETKAPPASWAKEQHEAWSKIPKEAQDYIELREKQMLDGIEQYKDGYRYASEVNSAIEQFRDDIKDFGLPDKDVVYNLLSHHRAITRGTLEQRQQAFLQIGRETGLIPKEGQEQVDPRILELQQRQDYLERQEQQRQQQFYQQELKRVTQTVEEFSSDPKNKYFYEVYDDIATLMRAGLDLPSAYERAVWANPSTRAKEIEALQISYQEKAKQEAEMAKKAASVNIRASNGNAKKTEKVGSMDNTLWETYRKIHGN